MLISLMRRGKKEFNKKRLVQADVGSRDSVDKATQLDLSVKEKCDGGW
jgi:hypothetical protein